MSPSHLGRAEHGLLTVQEFWQTLAQTPYQMRNAQRLTPRDEWYSLECSRTGFPDAQVGVSMPVFGEAEFQILVRGIAGSNASIAPKAHSGVRS